jgi:hypothetical protein
VAGCERFGFPHLLPALAGVGVILVEPRHERGGRTRSAGEADQDPLRRDWMARQRPVGQEDGDAPRLADHPGVHGRVGAVDGEALIPKAVQHLKGAVGGFGNPVDVQEAEAAMERDRGERVLPEEVGERPPTVSLDQARRLHHRLDDKRGGVGAVMQLVKRVRGTAPFGVVEGEVCRLSSGCARLLSQDAAATLGELGLCIVAGHAEGVQRNRPGCAVETDC